MYPHCVVELPCQFVWRRGKYKVIVMLEQCWVCLRTNHWSSFHLRSEHWTFCQVKLVGAGNSQKVVFVENWGLCSNVKWAICVYILDEGVGRLRMLVVNKKVCSDRQSSHIGFMSLIYFFCESSLSCVLVSCKLGQCGQDSLAGICQLDILWLCLANR